MSLYKYAKALDRKRKVKNAADYMPAAGAAGAAAGTAIGEYSKKTGAVQLKGTSSKIKRTDQRQYHLQRYRTPAAKAAFRLKVARSALGSAILGGLAGVAAKHVTKAMADAY